MHNTSTVNNFLGTFWYRTLRANLYNGFTIFEYWNMCFARASLAKALFDFLYLRPIPSKYRSKKFNLAEEIRLNVEELDNTDWVEFISYVESSNSPKMQSILRNFQFYL